MATDLRQQLEVQLNFSPTQLAQRSIDYVVIGQTYSNMAFFSECAVNRQEKA